MGVSRSLLLVLVFSFTLLGCATVRRSLDAYQACKADQTCSEEMAHAQEVTYVAAKGAASTFPSFPEAAAVVVSNLVAFGVGVLKGKRVKKAV